METWSETLQPQRFQGKSDKARADLGSGTTHRPVPLPKSGRRKGQIPKSPWFQALAALTKNEMPHCGLALNRHERHERNEPDASTPSALTEIVKTPASARPVVLFPLWRFWL